MTTSSEPCEGSGPLTLDPEHRAIFDLIAPGSRVLDLGCGKGDLLGALMTHKGVLAEGIEIAPECLQACVARGVPNVHQGDLDEGLADYADQSVDYVVLASTLQVLQRPLDLIREMTRVGRRCIVGFPNFAYWPARVQLGLWGRMPVTGRLPYAWHDTPNIHLTTIRDFRELCVYAGLRVLQELALQTHGKQPRRVRLLPNLRADYAVFLLTAH